MDRPNSAPTDCEHAVDRSEFEEVFQNHYPQLLRAALAMTGNGSDAEDLVQQTLLAALQGWQRFDGKVRIETWLYAILLNTHRKTLRWKCRQWRRWLAWFSMHERQEELEPAGAMEMQEWRDSLWSVVATLPPAQQHAVVLRYCKGLSYEQIAEVMGCPVGTVKSRMHHALAQLRRRLEDQRPSASSFCPQGVNT